MRSTNWSQLLDSSSLMNTTSQFHFRFSLRTLLAAMVVAAALLAMREWLWDVVCQVLWRFSEFSWIGVPVVLTLSALAAAWVYSSVVHREITMRRASAGNRVATLLLTLVTGYAVFAHHRWTIPIWETQQRALPYPDEFLMSLHDWIDRQRPAAPDSLKINAEYYTVRFLLASVVFVACTLTGISLGPAVATSYIQQRSRTLERDATR